MAATQDTLLLFDVDGTLTEPRQHIDDAMKHFLLNQVGHKAALAVVSGSDYDKILEQLGADVASKCEYVFCENGVVVYGPNGQLLSEQSLVKALGEHKVQQVINFCLGYMAKLELPLKRGNFIEFRRGMINVSPVGRSCSQQERIQFYELDQIQGIRSQFRQALIQQFGQEELVFALGGQISMDIFPCGWDKRYCLQHVRQFKQIHFFGDKTMPGGNDYEIYQDHRTIGHVVRNPQDTIQQVKALLGIKPSSPAAGQGLL